MKINIEPTSDQLLISPLHLSRSRIREVLVTPDVEKIVDNIHTAFIKRNTVKGQEFVILILGAKIPDGFVVSYLFKLQECLYRDIGFDDPIKLLRVIAEKFGKPFTIGNKKALFFHNETLQLSNIDPTQASVFSFQEDIPPGFLLISTVMFRSFPPNAIMECGLAFGVNTREYMQSLAACNDSSEIVVEIGEDFRGLITPLDVIRHAKTLDLRIPNYNPSGFPKDFFKIQTSGYRLSASLYQNVLSLKRDFDEAAITIPNDQDVRNIRCLLQWSRESLAVVAIPPTSKWYNSPPSELSLSVMQDEKICAKTQTLPTMASPSLLQYLRKQKVINESIFYYKEEFFEIIVLALQHIGERVLDYGAYEGYWDWFEDPETEKTTRKPKDETHIHGMLRTLLDDQAIAKSFQIIPEYHVAGGDLDYLATGNGINREQFSVCIEVKHAHSEKIFDGLLLQLPAYMMRQGSEFGVYCVLWFKDEKFSHPSAFETSIELQQELDKRRNAAALYNIRVIILELGHQVSPSKLKPPNLTGVQDL